jgi:hypothetical protein
MLLKEAFNTINQSTSHATRIERFNKGSDQLYRLLSLYICYLQYLMLSMQYLMLSMQYLMLSMQHLMLSNM